MAAFTCSACERHTTNTSCTPARARPSSVQSSSGALQIGRRHWPASSDSGRKQTGGVNLRAIDCQRLESLVETIGEDDGLKHLVCLIVFAHGVVVQASQMRRVILTHITCTHQKQNKK